MKLVGIIITFNGILTWYYFTAKELTHTYTHIQAIQNNRNDGEFIGS